MRGNGGVIGPRVSTTTTAAPGMWGLNESAAKMGLNYADLADTWPLLADPNFATVTVLCHFDEYSGTPTTYIGKAASYNLQQQSTAGKVDFGLSTAQSKFAAKSLLVGASRHGAANTTSIGNFTTADFTIECWFRQTAQSAAQVLVDLSATDGNTSSPLIEVLASNKLGFFHNPQAAVNITGGTTVSLNVWHHMHITRSSGTTYAGMDGVQEGADYTDANSYTCPACWVGQLTDTNSGANGFVGYIAELRINNGFARYARTYTVPTARFPDY